MNINELHFKFQEYGANVKLWVRKCHLLLPQISKYEVWKAKGFGSIYEYAAKLAGLTHGQVDDALYVLKKIEDKPAMMKVVEEKGINAVRPLIGVVNNENENFLAEKARELGHHSLRTYVKEFKMANWITEIDPKEMNSTESNFRGAPKNANKTKTIIMQVPAELASRLEKIKGLDSWAQLMEKFLALYEKNEFEESKKLEDKKPGVVKDKSRAIPEKIKTHVLQRSKSRCEFPNCSKKYHHLHHIDRFAIHKEHDPDRIVALCRTHHDLVHRSMVENESRGVKNWKIKTAQKCVGRLSSDENVHIASLGQNGVDDQLSGQFREFTEVEQQYLQFLINNWFVDHQYRLNQPAP